MLIAAGPTMTMKIDGKMHKSIGKIILTGADTWGVEAVGALKSACSGAGVTVAVLDSGIDAGHEAFTGVCGWASVLRRMARHCWSITVR